MPIERNSLVQSIRLTGNGITLSLRVRRNRPQLMEDFLRENDLTDRIDLAQQSAEPTNVHHSEVTASLSAA
jgi:hypothetical protein